MGSASYSFQLKLLFSGCVPTGLVADCIKQNKMDNLQPLILKNYVNEIQGSSIVNDNNKYRLTDKKKCFIIKLGFIK